MLRASALARAWAGAITLVVALAPFMAAPVGADPGRIRPGAVELGMAASITAVEGSAHATLALRVGTFVAARSGLAGFEAETQYHHQRSLDVVDLQASVSWQRPVAGGAAYPFVATGGGVRQEKLGSFGQTRYPVGVGLGLRVLFGARAAVRVEYRYRRVLGDPVADFNEHQVLTGLSLLLRNGSPNPGTGR